MSAANPESRFAARSPGDPEHRVPLAGGWTMWPWVWLRSAGFPADLVLRMAGEEGAAAAARCANVSRELDSLRSAALAACERALVTARGAESARLARAVTALRAGTVPRVADLPSEVAAAVDALARASEELAAVRSRLDELLTAEGSAGRAALQDLVRAGPMREALVWQNRRFVRGSVDAFLRRSPDRVDSKVREYERVLATYLQRYCVKNDTIGFFGPVGWARWSAETGVRSEAVGELLAERTVYFEHWAVDALAAHLAAEPGLRQHLAPRRMPTVRLEGRTLFYGTDRSAELPASFARLLAACDGEASAVDIAARMADDPEADLPALDDVLEALAELAGKGLVTWTLELPTADPHPQRTLRRLLERVPDPRAREPAVAALDRLEGLRERVAAAAGDAEQLDLALDELERVFVELTGLSPSRRAGTTYAGRGLVFEDCRRAGEVELGVDLRHALGRPLQLLLASARWYTFEIARRYRARFAALHAELRAETGQSRIPMTLFRQRVDPSFASSQLETAPIVREVADLLDAGWKRVLAAGDGEHSVVRDAAALEASVGQVFAAPGPGWPSARYHSPDVLIAARDLAAIAAGDYRLVLGELHVGLNTLLTHVALQQHPRPADLVRAREIDRPEPGIAPVEAKDNASRADNCPAARHDFHLEIGATRSFRPRGQVLAIADLVVEEMDGRLYAASRDRRHRFDIVSFFDQDLTFAAISGFRIFSRGRHTPRVTIDRLVVARERWSFESDELGFAGAGTALDRMIGAQSWREAHRLPRFLFARVPGELKPLYVDLSSSSYVEILAKCARRGGTVELGEMLPGHGQNWLTDAAGRRYTSELRMAVLDPVPWRGD